MSPTKTEELLLSPVTQKTLGHFPKPPDGYTPADTITAILNVLFAFLGILAVSFIIYAGYLWMTSGGEVDKAKKARTLLIDATIGAAIIMAAWGLVYVVGFALYQIAKP